MFGRQLISFLVAEQREQLKEKHLEEFRKEREYLWKKRQYCQENPRKAGIIEADGMDQFKTNVPHVADAPKDLSNIFRYFLLYVTFSFLKQWPNCFFRLKIHIIGGLVNGVRHNVAWHYDNFKHDPNLTVMTLILLLFQLPRPWPTKLFVQLDNCIRENKNAIVFAFCAYLVMIGLFEEVISTAGFRKALKNVIKHCFSG